MPSNAVSPVTCSVSRSKPETVDVPYSDILWLKLWSLSVSISVDINVDSGWLTVETDVAMMDLDPESVVSWSVPSRRDVLRLEVVLSVLSVLSEGEKLWDVVVPIRAVCEISGSCVVCLIGSRPLDERDKSYSLFFGNLG